MKRTFICFCLIYLMLAGCSQTQQVPKISSTTFPEATYEKSADEVKAVILSGLLSLGATLEESNENTIIFHVPDENATLRQAFFSCAWCERPYLKLSFVIIPLEKGDKTKVVVQYWYEIPQANGGVTRMESTSNQDYNSLQQALWEIDKK